MMDIDRQRRKLLAGMAGAGLAALGAFAVAQPEEQTVRVSAKRFSYEPDPIRLKKGVPAVLELTSLDVMMGFNAPDFGVRSDIPPGMVSRVRFTPEKSGQFVFHCDIFCGSGHEDMAGVIVVA
jgi:cytochrome c oxidase subunit 2